jgi:hypothetical protein
MSLRFYALMSEVGMGAALLLLPMGPVAGQTPPPAAKTTSAAKATKPSTPARTPEGLPDLQGYWTNATNTSLERPVALGTKEFYTKAEAEEIEQKRIQRENSQKRQTYDKVWQLENWGNVTSLRTSIIFDPPDGRIPPMTAKGEQHVAAEKEAIRRGASFESAQARPAVERCLVWGNEGPPMLGSTYNANLQIMESVSLVVIRHEMIHNTRLIPMDKRPHVGSNIRFWGGDSRGHWEGDTLVVDTTNFTSNTNFRPPPSVGRQDIYTSDALHVIERFTRSDADTIVYRFTVDDPDTWTKPWSGELLMKKTTGPIYEYACHEGNYGLVNMLTTARATEKANEGAAGKSSK